MSIRIIYETHSTTDDNETGRATGWLPGRLSATGRHNAVTLGRRRGNGIDAVFSSDLGRARQTVDIAFSGSSVPVLLDWRLRECDYGTLNGAPTAQVHADRLKYLRDPYPGGESWEQATERVKRFLDDLPLRWDGCQVLVVGHVATRWGLERWINGSSLVDLTNAELGWQEGWQYQLN